VSWLSQLVRPDILALQAYEHAVWEPGLTRLHANELPWRSDCDDTIAGLNRYPEPQPPALVAGLARLYGVAADSLLVARGSDDAIDVLVRAFCRAGSDAVLICPPTFGMYAVSARIQGARVVSVPLKAAEGFTLDVPAVFKACTPDVRIVFLCSPNNPTGNLLNAADITAIVRQLEGRALVVVDEAYIEFAEAESCAPRVRKFPGLAVLRTLSKAHGHAGARCGSLIADPEVIALLRKVITPYAISQLTLEAVLKALGQSELRAAAERITQVRQERARLSKALGSLSGITRVWPSAANFLLAQFADPDAAMARARAARLLVRDVRGFPGLGSALRTSIGSAADNDRLLEAWA
jgi:histidinol-phosphate aminotransferase